MSGRTEQASAAAPALDTARRVRRSDVDWLRVLAVGTVLVVHAAQVFSPWQTWHVQDVQRSKVLAEGMLLAGLWVLPLFMLLAGRSARYARESRSDAVYVRSRFERLFVPLVVGSLLLIPPQLYVRRLTSGEFDGSFLEFYPHFFTEGLYPEGNLSWGHLWFLAYLLVYAVATLPLLRRIDGAVKRAGDVGRRARGVHLVLLAAPSIAAQVALRGPYPQTNALLYDWANHAVLLPAFLAGYLLAAWAGLEDVVVRTRRTTLTLALVASAFILAYAWPGSFDRRMPASLSAEYVAFWTLYGIAVWTWLFALCGYGRVHLSAPPAPVRLRDMVYPFYVFHQTVLVVIAWPLVTMPLALPVKFLLLVVAGFAGTIALCLLVESAGPLRPLFGMRARRTGA